MTMTFTGRSYPYLTLVLATLTSLATMPLPKAQDRVEETFEKTYSLAADGRVSVGNVNGAIEIQGWDRAEVELKAVKSARTRAQLDAIGIEVEASANRLEVNTRYPEGQWRWKNDNTRVEYTLKVPAGARLEETKNVNGSVKIRGVRGSIEAKTVNGSVVATDLQNNVDISTVNGSADARFDSLEAVKHIEAKSVNGGVTLVLPAKPDAQIAASSVNGGIGSNFDLPVKKKWPVGRELSATLGTGATRVKASTVNGRIRIDRAPGQ